MEIASSPTSPLRTSRSIIRTESPTHPGSNSRVRFLTFPWGKVPPQRRERGGTGLVLGPALHPSGLCPATLSQERVFPSSVPGCARSTLSAGEGFLRRGHSLTFPWGKVPPQRRKRGGTGLVLGTAPHPSGLRPATLSQERVFPLIRPGLRPVHLPRRGRLPPGGCVPLPSPGGRCRRSGGRGAVPGWFWVPPHTRQGYALPPSPRRGFFPSSVPGCARSTFPAGEGFLPAGAFPYLAFGFTNIFSVYPLYESPIVL